MLCENRHLHVSLAVFQNEVRYIMLVNFHTMTSVIPLIIPFFSHLLHLSSFV